MSRVSSMKVKKEGRIAGRGDSVCKSIESWFGKFCMVGVEGVGEDGR